MSSETPESVWAIVEQMGHVKLSGRISEEEKFGAKMMRIDIPMIKRDCKGCRGKGKVPLLEGDTDLIDCPCTTFFTKYVSGASLYSVSIVSEAAARLVASKLSPEPVHVWDLPKQLPPSQQDDDAADGTCEVCGQQHTYGPCL